MEKKVIGLCALALVALAAYQAWTGGITAKGPQYDAANARVRCADAAARVRAIRSGAPLRGSETIGVYKVVLEGCRADNDLTNEEIGLLLGS